MGSGGMTQTKSKTKKGESEYTNEDLAILNHFKPLKNLWRELMSAFDTEFKPTKGPPPQFTKGRVVIEEVLDSLQPLRIATLPAIVRLASIPERRQKANFAVLHVKTLTGLTLTYP